MAAKVPPKPWFGAVGKFCYVKSIKPSPHSVEVRLPEAYKKYLASLKLPPAPVHYIHEPEKWKLDPITKQKQRVENIPIPLKFPKEADEGIWGGEGVIQGFIKEIRNRRRFPNYWVPNLKKTVVYSEILNQYMQVTVTERTLRLIDENCGFDHYILSSPVQDLKSQLALTIRRKMLLALVNGEKYHESEEVNQKVFEKYKKYMIPKEEAEWFGLTLRQAIQKQRLIEEEIKPVPLKHQFRLKLIEELKRQNDPDYQKDAEQTEQRVQDTSYFGRLSRLNPFLRGK